MRKKSAILLIVFLLAAHPAHASNPFAKLGRGITNIVFSPFEIFTNVQKIGDKKGWASGLFEGLFTGTGYMVLRILSGAYDVVTFPVPLPDGYEPIMKPAYVFEAAADA